ncbi:hypothetical protein GGR56DRAFT_61969 [Xylariaceae sp. FL0804]|nr:hypothetical protein GGR56DRAFT_61969 [Xylariaceae sp. FL0804]
MRRRLVGCSSSTGISALSGLQGRQPPQAVGTAPGRSPPALASVVREYLEAMSIFRPVGSVCSKYRCFTVHRCDGQKSSSARHLASSNYKVVRAPGARLQVPATCSVGCGIIHTTMLGPPVQTATAALPSHLDTVQNQHVPVLLPCQLIPACRLAASWQQTGAPACQLRCPPGGRAR